MYQPLPSSHSSATAAPSSTSPPPRRRHLLSADSCFGVTLILLLATSVLVVLFLVYQAHHRLHSKDTAARQWPTTSSELQQLGTASRRQQHLASSSASHSSSSATLPSLLTVPQSAVDHSTAIQRHTDEASARAEDAAYYSDHDLVPVSAIEQQAAAVLAQHASSLIPDPPGQLNLSAIAARVAQYSLLWDFGGVGCSGFAIEASNLLYGLSLFLPTSSLYVIRSSHACPGLPPYVHALLTALSSKPPPPSLDILVSHKPPPQYPAFPYRSYGRLVRHRPAYVIGRSMTEVHAVPRQWGDRVNERVDECWLTSRRQVPPFLMGGAEASRLWVVGEPLDTSMWDEEERRQRGHRENGSFVEAGAEGSGLVIKGRRRFNFLSVFKLEERKAWKELVYAFMNEFTAEDDVALFIHTYLHASFDQRNPYRVQSTLLQHIRSLNLSANPSPPYASVHVVTQTIPTSWLPRFYSAFDAFVLPTHGEGWGLPMAEALLSGLPLLATNASTHLEYVNADNAYLLPVVGYERAEGPEWAHDRGDDEQQPMWPTVSVSGLRRAMRRVADDQHQEERAAKGRRGREDMRRLYSVRTIAERMVRRLYEITKVIDAQRNKTSGGMMHQQQ